MRVAVATLLAAMTLPLIGGVASPAVPALLFDMVVDEARGKIYGSDRDAGVVHVIDMGTLESLGSVDFAEGSKPSGLDMSPDGSELAVALFGAGQVAFVDLETLTVTATPAPDVTNGPNVPFDVLHGREGRLYSVGNPDSSGLDYVHVFDTATHTEIGKSTEVMRSAPRLAMTSDRNTLYVSDATSFPQKIYRFDIATDTPVQTAAGPHGPVQANTIAVDASGTQVFSSRGQVWSGDLNTLLGSFAPAGEEIEYSTTHDRFFVTSGTEVREYDSDSAFPLRIHGLASTGGVARVSGETLYVSTVLGVESFQLDAPTNSVASVVIEGPASGDAGVVHEFTATVSPSDATEPVIYFWNATEQNTQTHLGASTDTASFEWLTLGSKTVSVTARNLAGEVLAEHEITVTGTPQPAQVRYFDMVVDEARGKIYGSDRDAGVVHVIDMVSQGLLEVVPVGEGSKPSGLDMSPDGSELAVALFGAGQVAFVDVETLTVTATPAPDVNNGPNHPFDVLYGREGRLYSVGNPDSSGLDYVHVFDTVSHTEIGRSTEVMREGPRLAMTSDRNTLYISQVDVSPEKIYRFDIATDTPVQTAAGPHGPMRVTTLAVNGAGTEVYSSRGQVWSGDLSTQLASFSPIGNEIEFSAAHDRFYVTSGSTVTEYDVGSHQPTATRMLRSPGGVARVSGETLYVSTDRGVEPLALNLPKCGGRSPTIIGTSGPDVIQGTATIDVVLGLGGNDMISGLRGKDFLCGGAGKDVLIGGAGNDRLYGGSGDDVLRPGSGADTAVGNAGRDHADFSGAHGPVVVDLATGTATGQGTDALSSVEDVLGSRFDDVLRGDGNVNKLDGRDGSDEVYGEAGADTLGGGLGDDILDGGGGNDVLDGQEGNDRLIGGWGADTLRGGTGDDIIYPGGGNDTAFGQYGVDAVSYEDATRGVKANLATATATGSGTDEIKGFEWLEGSQFKDTLTGTAGDNLLFGLRGHDTIKAGSGDDLFFGDGGADTLLGGNGDDTLVGGSGHDTLKGGPGTDTASFWGSPRGVTVNLGAGTATGEGADSLLSLEWIVGTQSADTLTGNTGHNLIEGRGGADTIRGSSGSDFLVGFEGNDRIYGDANDDILLGDEGNDALDGGTGTDDCWDGETHTSCEFQGTTALPERLRAAAPDWLARPELFEASPVIRPWETWPAGHGNEGRTHQAL